MHVAHENLAAAPRERCERHHDADRPRAKHDGDVARLDARAGRRLHAHGEGFDHRALFVSDVVSQLESEGGWMHHRTGETAMHGGRRPERHVRVDIIDAQPRAFPTQAYSDGYPAWMKKLRQSGGVISSVAMAQALQRPSSVRLASLRKMFLNLAKACSIGSRSGL